MEENATYPSLLDLPAELILEIMTYMNIAALKNLRLVSSKMKSFVEHPKQLQKLQICLKNDARMEDILRTSSVPWNSIAIPHGLCNSEAQRFLIEWSQHCITRLKFTTQPRSGASLSYFRIRAEELLSIMEHVGPQLQSLEIGSNFVELSNAVERSLHQAMNRNETKRRLTRNLKGLRELRFQNMTGSARSVVHFVISTLLKMCPNLVTLQLPITGRDKGPGQVAKVSENPENEMCAPLISYLTELSTRTTRQLSRIDFGYVFKKPTGFFYPNLPSVFPLTQSTILPIIKLCKSSGVKIYSVPIDALPTTVTRSEQECLSHCIKSVVCFNQIKRVEDMPLYMTASTSIDIACSTVNANSDESAFELGETLNISSITLQCDGRRQITNFTDTYHNLLNIKRPSLTRLLLQGKNSIPFREFKLADLFPNLETLYLSEIYDYDDKATLESILTGLQHLKDLTLKDCNILSNYRVGYDVGQLPFLKSLRLTRLELIRCSITFRPNY